MKTTTLFFLLFPFILAAQLTPKYSSVAIQISQANMLAFLNEYQLNGK